MINWNKTNRGFVRGEFKDRYGAKCSIHRSSIAFEDCLWLGLNDAKVMSDGMPIQLHSQFTALARMQLNREMCGELGKILTEFSETGRLNGDASEE